MSIRRFSANENSDTAKYRPYINTGQVIDTLNGKFMLTENGTHVISGGLGVTTGIVAKANMFKSSLQNGCAVNAMARFPDSEYNINDSEGSALDKDRLANMSDLYLDEPEKREAHLKDLKDRIILHDVTTEHGQDLDSCIDHMKAIRDDKIKHYKDYEVETEILDLETMKPYRMLIPTFYGIDSWTMAQVRHLLMRNEDITAETEMSKQRNIFMEEGLKKMHLMSQLPRLCAQGGIYCLMTGHIGKKISMDGRPLAKDMLYMKQDETTKAMGNKFEFLMSTIFQIVKTTELSYDGDKKLSEFPSDHHISGAELQELAILAIRSKNAAAGSRADAVSSQSLGIMSGLSYYKNLRNNKYYGLGSPNKVRNPLLGDLNIGRTKIHDLSLTYEVRRAMELTYQLFHIQRNWHPTKWPCDLSISIEEFAERLDKSSYATSDILNSRGWWTYKGAKVDRDLMSLPDIVSIISQNYTPKLVQVPA